MEGKLIANYTLGKILGKGSFGEVYEARLEGDPNLYAVKVYSKSILDSHHAKNKILELIQNETESMKKLNHRNLLNIYKYLESSNNFYLFLEYCEGGDLSNVLINSGPLQEIVVKKIAIELISGFLELDKQKIMHRDMKLENVMICKGRFVICDFGFSKVNQIQTSTHLGTQIYMAPEIAGGKYDNRVDVWSLGVLLYILFFGTDPWRRWNYTAPEGDNRRKMNNSIYEIEKYSGEGLLFPPSPVISEQAKQLLKRMICFNPDQRINWKELALLPYISSDLSKYELDMGISKQIGQPSPNSSLTSVLEVLGDVYSLHAELIDICCRIEVKKASFGYILVTCLIVNQAVNIGLKVEQAYISSQKFKLIYDMLVCVSAQLSSKVRLGLPGDYPTRNLIIELTNNEGRGSLSKSILLNQEAKKSLGLVIDLLLNYTIPAEKRDSVTKVLQRAANLVLTMNNEPSTFERYTSEPNVSLENYHKLLFK